MTDLNAIDLAIAFEVSSMRGERSANEKAGIFHPYHIILRYGHSETSHMGCPTIVRD